ncbi:MULTISPECIES: antibiotic biosynthesis monooxygenase family protein [Dehalobacter]|uniref:Antibiotic biosynthesis monooxygenase n=1 Tax=Dehalobacter restrictus TaxID=55583 RepID=A0A857DF52_9FIRM|nr:MULTISPECIES: antibiotic biosynthesis monooxygenase family protein [Dehalobacter]MCG1025857.1 antibiotic biosynthesis monooxygenase [Dehalobacter sp.]OCZ50947.1 hypothetical protein A7D23_13650 [Dehalobacter sp. TeCB1]QGZ99909.1 antibiotic biosynthesis monooxygenase [Dehalobacter restrictus]
MSKKIIPNPEEPFTFINVFEIPVEEVDSFIEQWRERSKLMSDSPGFLGAELNRALLTETRFQLINIAKYESYAAFEAATTNSKFKVALGKQLDNPASNMIPNRGFYRPVAIADSHEG